MKFVNLPGYLTSVTKTSKLFALVLFLVLPIIGTYVGYKYGRAFPPEKEEVIATRTVTVDQEDTEESLLERCGYIENSNNLVRDVDHFTQVEGPFWAPDCRHMAWSVWQSGTGWIGDEEEGVLENINAPIVLPKEGLFLYNDRTKTTKKIYSPKLGETPELIKWVNSDELLFRTTGQKDSEKIFSINTGIVSQNEN